MGMEMQTELMDKFKGNRCQLDGVSRSKQDQFEQDNK